MYNYLMMNAYTPCFILKFSLKPLLKHQMSTFRLSAFLLCNKFLLQDLEVRRKIFIFAGELQ